MDNIEVEFCEDHAKKRKTSDVEFKNDSFGELIIQPAQSILKKKKSVSFVILETDEVITINDDEEDDDLPIATRIRKMKRNKKKAASPLPSKSTKSKKLGYLLSSGLSTLRRILFTQVGAWARCQAVQQWIKAFYRKPDHQPRVQATLT